MIIRFPTGLYKSILPRENEVGNITYTISTQAPPSVNIVALQIPVVAEISSNPERIFTDEERREQFGELVFSVSQSNRSEPGTNTKSFEVGEILIFTDEPPIEEINTVRAPEDVEIRHNTNLLDLVSVGLTEEEIDSITKQSASKQVELEKDFANKRREISDLETNIKENQKKINESNKTIKALRGLFNVPEGAEASNEIISKIVSNLDNLEKERDELIADRNTAALEAEAIYQSIINIAELVR